jgi:hypothetical protein
VAVRAAALLAAALLAAALLAAALLAAAVAALAAALIEAAAGARLPPATTTMSFPSSVIIQGKPANSLRMLVKKQHALISTTTEEDCRSDVVFAMPSKRWKQTFFEKKLRVIILGFSL